MKLYNTASDIEDLWLDGNEPERDNDGQLIFYTGLYEHADGTIHDTPEVTPTCCPWHANER